MKYSTAAVILAVGLIAPAGAQAYGINKSQTGHAVRWGVDTVAFRLDMALVDALPPGDAVAATAMAFDAWRGLPRVPDLIVRPGTPTKVGYFEDEPESNGIYWIGDWTMNPDMLAVTVVTYGSATGEVLDADVLVNGEAAYRLLDESGPRDHGHYDLAAVMTHEAGHTLGLDESDADLMATMWPQVHPGDTHQRTLSEDDEAGVIANYAGSLPEAPMGCGQASVLGRSVGRTPVLGLAFLLFAAAVIAVRGTRRMNAGRALWAVGLCAWLCAAPVFVSGAEEAALERAHADDAVAASATVKVAPIAPIAGPRPQPSAHAHGAPAANDDARLARTFGANTTPASLVRGRVQRTSAAWKDGLIMTLYTVRDAAGREQRLELLGGEVDGIGQRVSHGDPPPADGDEILVRGDEPVAKRWAYYRDGQAFGGSLGRGPAIQID